MSSPLAKRLDTLEALLTAKLQGPPVVYMLKADDLDPDATHARLIAEGKITSTPKLIMIAGWRWRPGHGIFLQPAKPQEDPALGSVPTRDDRTDSERVQGVPP